MRQQEVTGFAAAMTVVAMGLGNAAAIGDLTVLSTNMPDVRGSLQFSGTTASVLLTLSTLALASAVLGAGVLGDVYGMRRMFVAGACGAVVFGLLGAAAPNVAVLVIARIGIGVAFAFLLGLSLAITNAVFPPDRRAGAIARYLTASYAFGILPPTVGTWLIEQFGWRSGFLVTPALASISLLLTLRYVPETQRSNRGTDFPGLLLMGAALVAMIYGISRLQTGVDSMALGPIAAGLLLLLVFVMWERRTDDPAMDLRLFRSARFNAALGAGATSSLVQAVSVNTIVFYLVIVRGEPAAVFAVLLIPTTLLSALAAAAAGRAAARFGCRPVLVAGLTLLVASLLVRLPLAIDTPIVAVGVMLAMAAIGGAIVQTGQATVMMSSAPPTLGGVVSAVRSSVGGVSYALGSALFAVVGLALFMGDADGRLAGSGISAGQARDALRVANGATASSPGAVALDPEQTIGAVSAAATSMVEAAHGLSLIMAAFPAAAIILVLVLVRRSGG